MTKKHKCDSMKTVEQTKPTQKRKETKINMANKFEMGSSEYAFPQQAKEHYDEQQLDQAQDMYSAIEYESGIDPDEYDSSNKEVTEEAKALIEMRKQREKEDKKRGHGLLGFVRNLAA